MGKTKNKVKIYKGVPNLKPWEIGIGNKLWLVLAKSKPTIKKSKVRGLEFDTIVVDEAIKLIK